MAKAALIIWVPWPGTSTSVSRGIDIIVRPPEPVCSTMIVSVLVPPRSPVWSDLALLVGEVVGLVGADDQVVGAGLVVGPVAARARRRPCRSASSGRAGPRRGRPAPAGAAGGSGPAGTAGASGASSGPGGAAGPPSAVRVPPGGCPPDPRASRRATGITRVSSGRWPCGAAPCVGTCWVASPGRRLRLALRRASRTRVFPSRASRSPADDQPCDRTLPCRA